MIQDDEARAAWLHSLGLLLKEARKASGYGQVRLCEASGITQGAYSSIEQGKADISAWRLQCILNVLGYELTIAPMESLPNA